MQGVSAKKKEALRVSIRREQIENYMKNRRKEISQHQMNKERCEKDLDNMTYWNLLNLTTFENLLSMDKQTLQNHLQMLNQIVSLRNLQPFRQRLEPLLCIFMEFFQYTYNEWFKSVKIVDQSISTSTKEEIVPLVVMNRMLSLINPNALTKFIGSIYYEIVPHNLLIVKNVLILMREMLSFSLKDPCILADFLKKTESNHQQSQTPMSYSVNRNSVLIVIMNITFSQDNQIMKIFYEQKLVQHLSEWIEVYGFTQLQKQSIAGIYANTIIYLCEIVSQSCQQSLQAQESKDYSLFLPIFEDLVKMQNELIMEKMIWVSQKLISTAIEHNLECKSYLLQLTEQLIRRIVQSNKYYQSSEKLFATFAEEYRFVGDLGWILAFLRIILNNYAFAYYTAGKNQKNRQMNNEPDSWLCEKKLCIQNLSKLMKCCESMLKKDQVMTDFQLQLECRKQIVNQLIQFWCKEDLFPLNKQFLQFMTTALVIDKQLAQFCLENQMITETIVSILNQSYELADEIEGVMKLAAVFISVLQKQPMNRKKEIVESYAVALLQLSQRIQGYCSLEVSEQLMKLIQKNLTDVLALLELSESI